MLNRILFAGGGTGGHVYMAIALANEIRTRNPEAAILFVGTQPGIESRIVPPLGFELKTIEIGALKRVGIARKLHSLFQLPKSFLQSARIIRQFSPSVIAGVGGYASGPVLIMGKLLNIPTLLIEPNLYPGFANRLLAPWVDRAAVAFEETARWFKKKAEITGIPIRKEFHEVKEGVSTEGPLRVLVFGGSRGSRAINNLLCEAVQHFSTSQISLVHQTGTEDFQRVKECYAKTQLAKAEILEFIHDMPAYFARTDLIISRSGASTLAEITAAGRPAILIPFPYAADDHQRKNANALARRNAALVMEEQKTSGAELAQLLLELSKNRERLQQMSQAGKQLSKPDSVDRIIHLMEEIAT